MPLGVQETVVIFVLALLVFGPKKLPELGRTIGKAITEFRRASSDLKASFEREMSTIEQENQSLKQVTRDYVNDTVGVGTNHYDNYYDSGAYGSESVDHAVSDNPSTVSASAPQGAENTVPAKTADAQKAETVPAGDSRSGEANSTADGNKTVNS